LDGNVDMGEEKLNLRMTAEPKNFSPFTVRSPIDITGTFLKPKVSPRSGPIATRVVGGILLAFVNPLAAILPFLDPGKMTESDVNCNDTLQHLRDKTKSSKSQADKSQAAEEKAPFSSENAQTKNAQENMK
jgi:hypothetical protein